MPSERGHKNIPDAASGALLRLGDFLREHREDILAAWEHGVRRMPVASALDQPTLIDHIPTILDSIADLADDLGSGRPGQLPKDLSEIHAVERLGEGFDLGQVAFEFSVLRDCITRLWAERYEPQHVLEFRVLNQAIDKAVNASIERYTKARDRTLEALDRISNAALESRTLDEFLARLLTVLVANTPAIETCTILIRESGRLRVRASIGLDHEVRDQITQAVGEGFAGTIAATRQPLELSNASQDPMIRRPALREAGLRVLYGVPLADGGDVIAVAHMGSRTANSFSKQDKRLFAAMASRATTAIFQHMLREQADLATAALRLREQEFRTLADNIPQLAWMADADGLPTWFNQRWLDYTGISAEQSRSGATSHHHPDHAARVGESWRRAVAKGQPWQDTYPLRGRDGRYRWFLTRNIPILDDAGAIVRWFGTATDVTEQRFLDEATKLLSGSLDRAETLDQLARLAVPDLADWCVVDLVEEAGELRRVAIAHVDPNKIEFAREWSRRNPPDSTGPSGVAKVLRTGTPIIEPEISDEMLANVSRDPESLQKLRDLGLQSMMIAPLVARDRVLGTITLIIGESGRRYRPSDVEVARELGRRAGTAIDNAGLYQQSQRAIRTREEVLAIVSHDLRTPLAAIDLSATSLYHEYGAAPRARKQVEVIRRSSERMEHLINDLLDMATIEARGLSLNITSQDPVKIVEDAVEVHAPLAHERSIKILAEADMKGEWVSCDRDRIDQVLGNLIGNAKKYCRPGDVIFVRAALVGREARFSVADTGPGVSPDEMPHLFQPFWAAKRHGEKKGTGLGLYICKGIVEAHGGEIWVDSRPGEGTTLLFTLPLASDPSLRAPP